MNHWVWIFGDVDGLRWVLGRETMAFTANQASRLRRVAPGDKAVLYVTRRAFHNPTRDQARLAGVVDITGPPKKCKPVEIAGRDFEWFAPFQPEKLLAEREGPEVRHLVLRLERVKNKKAWGQYFRSSPISLSGKDFRILRQAVLDWKKSNRSL